MLNEEDMSISVADPFAKRLLETYVARREEDLPVLRELLKNGNFEALTDIAHKFYGSGSIYGLDAVSRLGGALEEAASQRDADRIESLLTELTLFLNQLKIV